MGLLLSRRLKVETLGNLRLLPSSNSIKIGDKYVVFQNKHDEICDYNPQFFFVELFGALWHHYDINTTENGIFTKIKRNKIYLNKLYLQGYK